MCDGKNILKLVHTSAPLTYYAISPPNKLCASEGATCYGICRSVCPSLFAVIMASVIYTYTRGPHALDWNTAVELRGARAKARASESICETSTSERDWRSCLRCFIIRLNFYPARFQLHSHLNTSRTFGTLSAPAPHPCSQTVLSVI